MVEDARGAVFDLGYQPYDGDRLGRRGATLAVYRDGLRRVLGLRRKARRKVLPWTLLVLAVIPAGFFVAFSVFAGGFEEASDAEFFVPTEYFGFIGTLMLLFIALAAAELMVPDRTWGTLQVYASRPLRLGDYLGARAGALGTVVFGFLMVPVLTLMIGDAALHSGGWFDYFSGNLDLVWKAALTSIVYLVAYAPLAFLVAAFANRTSFSAAIYAAIMLMSAPLTQALVDSGTSLAGIASLNHHPRYLADWIYDTNTHPWIPERAGYSEWVSLLVILLVAAASLLVVMRRYRSVS